MYTWSTHLFTGRVGLVTESKSMNRRGRERTVEVNPKGSGKAGLSDSLFYQPPPLFHCLLGPASTIMLIPSNLHPASPQLFLLIFINWVRGVCVCCECLPSAIVRKQKKKKKGEKRRKKGAVDGTVPKKWKNGNC